jgi:PAS domain S-box-containing protein
LTWGAESATTADVWPLVEVLPAGTVGSASPAFARCLGRSVAELTGVPFCDLVHPEDRLRAAALVRTGPDRAGELRFITAAGEERCLIVGPYPLPGAGSHLLLCCDVTEQRRAERVARTAESAARADARRSAEMIGSSQVAAERAAAESEKRLQEIFDVASDWFWETDADDRFTFLSSAWIRLSGKSAGEFIGKRRDEFGDSAVDPEAWRDHLAVLEARKPFRNFTYCLRSWAGALRWIRTTGSPVFGEQGQFNGYRGSATDVTTEMDSIRRAQAAHRLFAEVVENVPASLMVHDVDDRLVICNSVTRGYFPRTGHLLVPGSRFEDFARALAETGEVPAASGREEEWFKERMRGHRSPENAITRQYADGRWVQISERRMSDGATIGIRLDITELKKAEAQRLALVEQLQHSQKLEAIGTLAGGIAHELNNALVPVLALAKLTIKGLPQGSRERRNLETIGDAAERARDLVKNILAFSRKETPTRSDVDLVALVRRSLDLLRPVIPSTIRIEESIESVPPLLANPDELQQLLINLVANAAHAIGDQHGTIFIELAAADDTQPPRQSLPPSECPVRLSVRDTGCGMDEATMKHMFDPFFTTKAVGQGTGLGLSVVQGIVTQHGGRIAVESAVGRGTCFQVHLPRFTGGTAPREAEQSPPEICAGAS